MGLADRLKQLFADARPSADRTAAARAAHSTESAAMAERRKKPRVNAPDGTKVLVVDDSPTIVTMITRMLEQNDFIILEAGDGARGLEIARSEIPDIIFLDIVMPGMSGFAALRALRRDPATKNIPIVMISGNEQATEQFYLQRIGANDFMKKPFSRAEVFSRIERLLDPQKLPKRFQEIAQPGAAVALTSPAAIAASVAPAAMMPAAAVPIRPAAFVPTPSPVNETLDLTGKGIAVLGMQPAPARVRCVFLDGNRLDAWPQPLNTMIGLQRLSLYDNQLTDIPDSLAGLHELRHLSLGNNQLVTLPAVLCQPSKLESLNLGQNRIATLPESIDAWQQLRMLDLGHNALTALPLALGRLPQLSGFLYLGSNQLHEIPDALCAGWSQLGYLNAADNQLAALPASLGSMKGLVELRLYNNRIEALPESIGQLARLQELHLGNNRIAALPESIGQLQALKELHLSNNALTALPTSIDGMINLRRLELRNNRLATLPDGLGRLPQLTHLDLRGNALTMLPDGIATLPMLQKLDLRWNRLLTEPIWLPALRERGCLVYI